MSTHGGFKTNYQDDLRNDGKMCNDNSTQHLQMNCLLRHTRDIQANHGKLARYTLAQDLKRSTAYVKELSLAECCA